MFTRPQFLLLWGVAAVALSAMAAVADAVVPEIEVGLLQVQRGPGSITNRGSDFWLGFMSNNPLRSSTAHVAEVSLFVTTNEPSPVNFTVEYLGESIKGKAQYGSNTIVSLPLSLRVKSTDNSELGKGVHVTTDNSNEQIAIIGLNEEAVSSDAFLALPCQTYEGIDTTDEGSGGYQYFIFSSERPADLPGQSRFLMVPCQNDSAIEITPTHTINFPVGFNTNPSRIQIRAGESGTMTGQAGQTILVEDPDDLTGTIVKSNKPLSVFAGHECGLVPATQTACDHLVEQLPAHLTWGTTFLTAPLGLRQSGEIYRVGSIYDGTEITITCTQQETKTCTINSGEYCEFITAGNPVIGSQPKPTITREEYQPEFCCIQTNKKTTVMGYSQGHSVDEVSGEGGAQGDPFMIVTPPITQYLNNYTITTPNVSEPFAGYISYIIPVQFFDGSPFAQSKVLIDGEPFEPTSGYSQINCTDDDGNEVVCGYGAYSFIGTGDHTILYDGAENAAIHVYAYGFLRENAYGYPAGMELQPSGLPRISCLQENTFVNESDGIIQLHIERTGNMEFGSRVEIEVVPITATGDDFKLLEFNHIPELRFRRNSTVPRNGPAFVEITNDTLVESNEQFRIIIKPLRDAFLYPFPTCTVTILDDDSTVVFNTTDVVVREEEGVVTVCLQRDGEIGEPLVVEVIAKEKDDINNPAHNATDFDAVTTTVTFQPTQGSVACANITIVDDTIQESTEIFTVVFNPPPGTTHGPVIAEVTIIDSDRGQFADPPNSNNSKPDFGGNETCIIEPPLMVSPFSLVTGYNFRGTCERTILRSCNRTVDFEVTADFITADESNGAIGVKYGDAVYISLENGEVETVNAETMFQNETTVTYANGTVLTRAAESNTLMFPEIGVTVSHVFAGDEQRFLIIAAVGSPLETTCGLCGTQDGVLLFKDLQQTADPLMMMEVFDFANSYLVPPADQSLRPQRKECGLLTNDTVIGDPLFTVPIRQDGTSLCYEVHGRADTSINLVSDTCVNINAYYSPMIIPDNGNIISQIGVRAVNNISQCDNIRVELDQCRASINGAELATLFRKNGVTVQPMRNRVRISVPNCENICLVLWVLCQEIRGQPMIKFQIKRGLNLRPSSHGLLGQFWNIPISYVPYDGELPDYLDALKEKLHIVTVEPENSSPARSFLAEEFSRTWENRQDTCFYAGNGQAGRSGMVAAADDSVVEGSYSDYLMSSIFEHDFVYSQFEGSQC